MVGSAIVRNLRSKGYVNIVTASRSELDLMNQAAVQDFFAHHPIDQVYLAAAKVGGIHANNTHPAEFIYENLMMEANVVHAAHVAGVQMLLFLGSSCIYPKFAEQLMTESALLTGVLEPTNESYAIAKIAGIKLCESYNRQYGRDYRSVMPPTNLYGPNETFSANTQPMLSHINVGTGVDCTIRELVQTVAKVTSFAGRLEFDSSKPDGAPRKLLDVSRLRALGWQASIGLDVGLRNAYQSYVDNLKQARAS